MAGDSAGGFLLEDLVLVTPTPALKSALLKSRVIAIVCVVTDYVVW